MSNTTCAARTAPADDSNDRHHPNVECQPGAVKALMPFRQVRLSVFENDLLSPSIVVQSDAAVVVTASRPEQCAVLELPSSASAAEQARVRRLPGFFIAAAARLSGEDAAGAVVVVGRHGPAKDDGPCESYRLFQLDVLTLAPKAIDVEAGFDIGNIVAAGDGALVVPSTHRSERYGAVPLLLRRSPSGFTTHPSGLAPLSGWPLSYSESGGRAYVQAFVVDGQAFCVWDERLHRFDGDRFVVVGDGDRWFSPTLDTAALAQVPVAGGAVVIESEGTALVTVDGVVQPTRPGLGRARGFFALGDGAVFVWQRGGDRVGCVWWPASDEVALVPFDDVFTKRHLSDGFARLGPDLWGCLHGGGAMAIAVADLLALPRMTMAMADIRERKSRVAGWKKARNALVKKGVPTVPWPPPWPSTEALTKDEQRTELVEHSERGAGVVLSLSQSFHQGVYSWTADISFESERSLWQRIDGTWVERIRSLATDPSVGQR